MSHYDHDAPIETMWAGRFLRALRKGKWEYVARVGGVRAAVILAEHDGCWLLVEQYRVPLGQRCLELPAGLVGDLGPGDSAEAAARRELEEETGFRAERITSLGEYFSSPGMVSESFTLLRAEGLRRVGPGGGVDGEEIEVHLVQRAQLAEFVAERRARGVAIDVKLLMLLGTSAG